MRYGLSYITFNYYSGWARYSYRTAFVAAAVTYGIVVYKAYVARGRGGTPQRQNVIALAGDENVQYMGMWVVRGEAFFPFSRTNLIERASLLLSLEPTRSRGGAAVMENANM